MSDERHICTCGLTERLEADGDAAFQSVKAKLARATQSAQCKHYFESWNDTCRYCGAIKPDASPSMIHYCVNKHEDWAATACNTSKLSWISADDWAKVTCPECLKTRTGVDSTPITAVVGK